MSPDVVRLGIAGLGRAGRDLLPAVRRNRNIRLAAVAEPNSELVAASRALNGCQVFDDLESMLRSAPIDLVYIATPTHLHTDHVLAAVSRGKHVIVEKPMALSLQGAERMIEAAESGDRVLVVGHSQSFEPPIRAMAEAIAAGEIGRLRMMHTMAYTDWMYRPRLPAELDTRKGGGVVFRQAAHQVDILRWLGGGKVKTVRAEAGIWDPDRPTEGSYSALLTFEGGVAATAIYNGYGRFSTRELTFGRGEDGVRGAVEPGAALRRLREAAPATRSQTKAAFASGAREGSRSRNGFFGLTLVSGERGDIRQTREGLRVYTDEGTRDIPVPSKPNGRDLLLREAYAAIVDRHPPDHNGRWGMANLEVCLAILDSSRRHEEVSPGIQVSTRS